MHAVRAGGIPRIAHKNFAAQIRAGGNDHALGAVLAVQLGHNALHMAVLRLNAHDLCLMDGKAGRPLKGMLHVFVVALAVGLHAQGVDSRALALVEHPALQIGGIRSKAHHTAQCIQFAYQRSFRCAANAGIAGHIANGIQTHGKHGRFRAQCRGGVGGFDAGVAGTDDDNVIIS